MDPGSADGPVWLDVVPDVSCLSTVVSRGSSPAARRTGAKAKPLHLRPPDSLARDLTQRPANQRGAFRALDVDLTCCCG